MERQTERSAQPAGPMASTLAAAPVLLPGLRGSDGRPRQPCRRTVEFAEALAFTDAWSRITEARRLLHH